MNSRKVKKDFWDGLFKYPSFNTRFWAIILLVFFVFISTIFLLIFKFPVVDKISDKIALFNLITQLIIVILGILAAYYALRQLVETRFNSLDESGMRELKNLKYYRAFEKWKEAFYIRPEPNVFSNMCETLLLIEDYETFDQYIKMTEKRGYFEKNLFEEISEKIILLYLKSIRHLLVKNQGEAEKYIREIVLLVKEDGNKGFGWDFGDLERSNPFIDLAGECKKMAENLISYIEGKMEKEIKEKFESGDYSIEITQESEN